MNLLPINSELASTQQVKNSELLTGVCSSVLAMYPKNGAVLPWVGYLAENNGTLVGTCAFKTPPSSGSVEIAYFTFPEYEGRGIATLMAKKLVALALENGALQITAQTLPEPNASTHILEKLGFRLAGSVIHPEDGEVWEWQLK